ncbi:hypothetical protein MMC12_003475 [Toensbergia leucococca]|nr:hypothetical protein [Toensbergia leucococca]
MSQPTVNGDKPSSDFISHLTSYPVVHDSISIIKGNPLGQKSISIGEQGYESFVKPILPYAQGPYGYVAPYVAKADSLATDGLSKVDQTFPIVKEDTETIKGSLFDLAFLPFRLANGGKDYVLKTYSSEYKKCGGDGVVSGGKAVITTGLLVTSDSLAWLSEYLGQKKEQTKDVVKEKTGN